MLNVDCFKPFDHSEYKVSALMMSVINLTKSERFKMIWTMVLGIIPAKGKLSSVLSLKISYYCRIEYTWNHVGKMSKLGVTTDIHVPALRKISQFLGHKPDLVCSHCMFKDGKDSIKQGASSKKMSSTHLSQHKIELMLNCVKSGKGVPGS